MAHQEKQARKSLLRLKARSLAWGKVGTSADEGAALCMARNGRAFGYQDGKGAIVPPYLLNFAHDVLNMMLEDIPTFDPFLRCDRNSGMWSDLKWYCLLWGHIFYCAAGCQILETLISQLWMSVNNFSERDIPFKLHIDCVEWNSCVLETGMLWGRKESGLQVSVSVRIALLIQTLRIFCGI